MKVACTYIVYYVPNQKQVHYRVGNCKVLLLWERLQLAHLKLCSWRQTLPYLAIEGSIRAFSTKALGRSYRSFKYKTKIK